MRGLRRKEVALNRKNFPVQSGEVTGNVNIITVHFGYLTKT